ncbi:cytidine and deoxycytidylate deaminase zinc-binding region [Ostertagia ostertagi]
MRLALREAQMAYDAGEVPVGAIVAWDDKIIGRGHNQVERLNDSTAHAEMIAMTAAFQTIGAKYLSEATLYVTVEPCLMCCGAMYWSKLGRIVFGTKDVKNGYRKTTEFIKLGGKFVFCTNELELLDGMLSLYDREDWQQLLCSSPRLLQLFHNNKMSFIKMADARDSGADACITDCEFLVARTGSVILSSRQHLGRMSSIYFPVHIVVAFASQLVPDIGAGIKAMQDRYGAELPSMINLNTGASRTADIEKTLVVGVHGPREKSGKVLLSAVMLAAIASCREEKKDEWISGFDEQGKARDTVVQNQHYRHYHGAWFPIIMGRISPATYNGVSAHDISRPGFRATRNAGGMRSGGFGRSSHSGQLHILQLGIDVFQLAARIINAFLGIIQLLLQVGHARLTGLVEVLKVLYPVTQVYDMVLQLVDVLAHQLNSAVVQLLTKAGKFCLGICDVLAKLCGRGRQGYNLCGEAFQRWKETYQSAALPDQSSSFSTAGQYPQESAQLPMHAPSQNSMEDTSSGQSVLNVQGSLLVTTVKSGLLVVHLRRARERILFERLEASWQEEQTPSQRLLFPISIELPPADAAVLSEMLADLKRIGFEIGPFGTGTYVIQGMPAGIIPGHEQSLIEEMIERMKHESGSAADVRAHQLLVAMAQRLSRNKIATSSQEELRTVIDELFACDQPEFTATGKKVFSVMPKDELDKWLG